MPNCCLSCGHLLKPHARYCAQCRQEIGMEPSGPSSPMVPIAPRAVSLMPLVGVDAELAAQAQLELHTRLDPLMNQERLKAMTMAIAAHGGTGTVGFWSDC